ncbi:MAG: LapA family protein [Thermodesulfobacteriota bacterium]|nr:LapA family protein [Thermodesulfobacteriota bacterium]
MKLLKTIFITALFIIGLTFAYKNQESVSVEYYFIEQTWTVPLFLLIFFSILIGVLIAGIGGVYSGFKLKHEIKRQQKIILELEDELSSLRNTPITDFKRQNG